MIKAASSLLALTFQTLTKICQRIHGGPDQKEKSGKLNNVRGDTMFREGKKHIEGYDRLQSLHEKHDKKHWLNSEN